MSSKKAKFVCQECGYETSKWMGKCPGCGSWNTLVEEFRGTDSKVSTNGSLSLSPLCDINIDDELRFSTGLPELNRVLGGGIVPGSLILVGGDPGIGKSTLLLQVANSISAAGNVVVYISGEESPKQVKIRARRLCVEQKELYIASETNIEVICSHLDSTRPALLIIDSIQTMYHPNLTSAPGSVGQVRECTAALFKTAKTLGIAVIIVGHVTKQGAIAGPRVLEHMVDCVLYFEGERHHTYRVIRSVKNRFGSTNELGVFEMCDSGLSEVANPSEMLLTGRPLGVPGSVVVCSLEGSRPVLTEVQALVSYTAFGMPRRMVTGVDYNRVVMLMAVLEKRVGLGLANQDAYINVAGGIRVNEPAVDLGIALAVASSFKEKPVDARTFIIGEVGLTGEVRGVSQAEKRVVEAEKLGFKRCIIPKQNMKGLKSSGNIEIVPVITVEQAIEQVF